LQIASYFSVPLSTVFALEEQLIEFTRQVLQEEHEELGEATLSLIPWSPMHTMREMLQPSGTAATHEPLFPAVNVWQSESDIWAEFRLPGYRTEDLSIEIGEDFLTVEGEESSLYSTTTHFIRREFQSRPFTRTISLPMAVYSEHSEAEMRSGILRIRLPKVVAPKPKTSRISIKSAD
jgi:HSP20 family protein